MTNYYYNEDFDEYDEDYEVGGRQKIKKRSKGKSEFKGKGHQTKYGRANKTRERDFWDNDIEDIIIPKSNTTARGSKSVPPMVEKSSVSTPAEQESQQTVLGAHCDCIKGCVIDFDRLADIQSVEGEHNGFVTYGIKFLFAGKKGLFRIIWYNKNKEMRDTVYAEKLQYWHSVTEENNKKKGVSWKK